MAYMLMSNHFHLCIATPKGNLSQGMAWVQGTFAKRFNRFRGESGHLFQGRFKSLIVEPGRHLVNLVNYIHLNPVQSGLCPMDELMRYRWSSLYHFPKRRLRPDFLDASWMDYEDGLGDTRSGWRRYQQFLGLRIPEDPEEVRQIEQELCRGWCIGGKDFKQAIAKDLLGTEGAIQLERDGLSEFNQHIWQAALEACLHRLGFSQADATQAKYSERWKLAIASKLKRETSVTNRWLARQLSMGVPNSVSNLCGVYRREAEARCTYARKLKNM